MLRPPRLAYLIGNDLYCEASLFKLSEFEGIIMDLNVNPPEIFEGRIHNGLLQTHPINCECGQ